jgi:hypothetical protein
MTTVLQAMSTVPIAAMAIITMSHRFSVQHRKSAEMTTVLVAPEKNSKNAAVDSLTVTVQH